jgi:hypothetical protein
MTEIGVNWAAFAMTEWHYSPVTALPTSSAAVHNRVPAPGPVRKCALRASISRRAKPEQWGRACIGG